MKEVIVKSPSKTYPIQIGHHYIDASFIGDLIGDKKAVIVTDTRVYDFYKTILTPFDVYVVKEGEGSKSIEVYYKVMTYLVDKGLTRKDLVIAFGGGIVGDLTGFVASTYMRGIPFIQIPTSLLAMVDSSVGGKVAINHHEGKNLIGQFYQPEAVYIDTVLLDTLEDRHYAEGMAEIIKYSLIRDKTLFKLLASQSEETVRERIGTIIEICVKIKAEVVEEDERDFGVRQHLNFGHTIGHAIEAYYHFNRYSHGEAISIGMAMKIQIAYQQGQLNFEEKTLILKTLEKYHLPIALKADEDFEAIIAYTKRDKKAEGSQYRLIMLEEIGKARIDVLSHETLIQTLIQK